MGITATIAYIAAIATAGIAFMVLCHNQRTMVHRIFIVGMLLLAVEACLMGLAYQAPSLSKFLFWYKLKLYVASLVPSVWLLFSLSFSRANCMEQVVKWKWVLLFSFMLPVSLISVFGNNFYVGHPVLVDTYSLFIRIGWSGYAWYLFNIIFAVLIIMNLERTFRHAMGHMRWQTKFMFLAIGSIFGVCLFTDSEAVLFQGVHTRFIAIGSSVLLIADILMLRSLFRGKPLNVSVHLSHKFLYDSFTVMIVGVYFIIVSVTAWISLHYGWISNIHIVIFMIFIATIGIAAILLSDRLRMQRKRFISRHFKRPQYDYRKIWEDFTARTTSVTQSRDLCSIIVMMVSATLEILSVSIWLVDHNRERLSLGGSTVFTDEQFKKKVLLDYDAIDLIREMRDQNMPVDLRNRQDEWVEDMRRVYEEKVKGSLLRYSVPLKAGGQLIGIMTMGEKVFNEPLSFEESELMKTISDQAAAALLNLRLADDLRQAKEQEAFQSMSLFFVHDLKNLASKLSLVTKNLPIYIDDPDYRQDALRTITQSVSKITGMSSRLSMLSRKLELTFRETNLNELLGVAVSEAKAHVKVSIGVQQDVLPSIFIDREQIQKVFENLIMNANEALNGNGQINIITQFLENRVEISVCDNGCGMSREFMEKNLFRPFQTTKKQGMGIGLYHCKTIVEAHSGRIEVESEERIGTTIRISLPVYKQNYGEAKN